MPAKHSAARRTALPGATNSSAALRLGRHRPRTGACRVRAVPRALRPGSSTTLAPQGRKQVKRLYRCRRRRVRVFVRWVLLGMGTQAMLPEHHLDEASKDTVKVGIGLVATMTALVLGLVTASAKSSFDAVDETSNSRPSASLPWTARLRATRPLPRRFVTAEGDGPPAHRLDLAAGFARPDRPRSVGWRRLAHGRSDDRRHSQPASGATTPSGRTSPGHLILPKRCWKEDGWWFPAPSPSHSPCRFW